MLLFQEDAVVLPIFFGLLVIIMFVIVLYVFFKVMNIHITNALNLSVNKKYYNRNLLILASKIIKADGKINKIEQGFVRSYFIKNYGKKKANKAFEELKEVTLDKVSIEKTAKKVFDLLSYQERFNFVQFLFGIAYSDGKVTKAEELEVRRIAGYLYLRKKDYLYLQSLFFKDFNKKSSSNYTQASNYYYETLGLSETVSDIEIKKTYRSLVKKYHPDKLINTTGDDVIVAKEQFQKIQEAYQKIKGERGF